MRKLKIVFFVMAFGLMICSNLAANAQCAACTAAVESNSKNGNSKVNGLNDGILWLLAAPYLAVAIGGYVWYKNYRRKNVALDIPNEKLNLN